MRDHWRSVRNDSRKELTDRGFMKISFYDENGHGARFFNRRTKIMRQKKKPLELDVPSELED